jgi:hypothetical protein
LKLLEIPEYAISLSDITLSPPALGQCLRAALKATGMIEVQSFGSRNHLHLRSRRILRQLVVKPVQLLKRFKACNRPSIFDAVTEEGRQDLDLLS